MNNYLGIALSLAYIALVLILATLLQKKWQMSEEGSRKLVHILVGNWVFITPLFQNLWALILVPALFVGINYWSKKSQIIQAMERGDDSWGTVYYALSLLFLSLLASLLNWPIALYGGVLIMAYGDGLAALIGQAYGANHPIEAFPHKSWPGSWTVLVMATVISGACLSFFAPALPLIHQLMIALVAGLLALLIELQGTRGLDNLTLPLGLGLFLAFATQGTDTEFLLYLGVILICLATATMKGKLSLDGLTTALVMGAGMYGLGGSSLAYALLTFFLIGTLATRFGKKGQLAKGQSKPRNWRQVVCNALPSLLMALLYHQTKDLSYQWIGLTVFAAAAADTLASELGSRFNHPVYLITNGQRVTKGLSGGVSLPGLVASLLGSVILALWTLTDFGWKGYSWALILGFLGSVIDSMLGALFQRKYLGANGDLQDKPAYKGQKIAQGVSWVSNNGVNLVSLSLVALLAYLVQQMIGS